MHAFQFSPHVPCPIDGSNYNTMHFATLLQVGSFLCVSLPLPLIYLLFDGVRILLRQMAVPLLDVRQSCTLQLQVATHLHAEHCLRLQVLSQNG